MNFAIEYFRKHVVAVSISILGFLSAIVTLFVDMGQSISIKWLVFVVFILLTLLVLAFGIIAEFLKDSFINEDVNQLKLINLNKPIRKGEVFLEVYLNKSGINFEHGDVVKVYYLDKDRIEQFIGIGVIEHIQKQENICHINFLLKTESNCTIKEVYFSLKINKDELSLLTN